jgi:hypothetical protein
MVIAGLVVLALPGCGGGHDSAEAPGSAAAEAPTLESSPIMDPPPAAMSADAPAASASVRDEEGLVPVEIGDASKTAEEAGLRVRITRCVRRGGGVLIDLDVHSTVDRRLVPMGSAEQPSQLYDNGKVRNADEVYMDGALIRSPEAALPVTAGKPAKLEILFRWAEVPDDRVDRIDVWLTSERQLRGFRFEGLLLE